MHLLVLFIYLITITFTLLSTAQMRSLSQSTAFDPVRSGLRGRQQSASWNYSLNLERVDKVQRSAADEWKATVCSVEVCEYEQAGRRAVGKVVCRSTARTIAKHTKPFQSSWQLYKMGLFMDGTSKKSTRHRPNLVQYSSKATHCFCWAVNAENIHFIGMYQVLLVWGRQNR